MKFLIDTNPNKLKKWVEDLPNLVAGQLIVPAATRTNWGGVFAMDNSAFTKFNGDKFERLQKRQVQNKNNCKFVTCPDVPGSGRRTLELWKHREQFSHGFALSLVIQDGMEDLEIPWDETPAVFIGGCDPWKDSKSCIDIVKTAKILGKFIHCGRVSTPRRYKLFAEQGVDTCDSSAMSLHDERLTGLARDLSDNDHPKLFN